MGHPVYQFLQKPDFSDFTVSGSGLAMGHRFRKYIYHFAGRIRILWPMLGGGVNLFLKIDIS